MADEIDPYDLGDTDLYPRQSVETFKKTNEQALPSAGGDAAAPQRPDAASGEPKTLPQRDPATGRFLPNEQPEGVQLEPPAQTHPQRLLQVANELGVFDGDDFRQPTHILERNVRRVQRERQHLREFQELARTLQGDRGQGQQVSAQPEPTPQAEPSEFDQYENELHPAIVNGFKSLKKYVKDEIEQLKRELGGVKQFQAARIQESRDAAFDRAILASADPKVVGTAPMHTLDTQSNECSRRRDIAREAIRLAGKQGGNDRVVLGLIAQAAENLLWAKKTSQPPNGTVNATGSASESRISPEDWVDGALSTPTHRRGAPDPKGPEYATARLTEKLRETGQLDTAAGDREIRDTLLS